MDDRRTLFRRSRRSLIRGGAAVAVAAFGADASSTIAGSKNPDNGCGSRRRCPDTKPDTRPNVVVVVADDMRTTDWAALPLTRARLREGAFYENFIINNPVCMPARATLFTGQYAHNHGIVPEVGLPDSACLDEFMARRLDEKGLALALQQSGYVTALVGKFLNGYAPGMPQPAGWTRWVGRSAMTYFDYVLQVDAERVKFRGRGKYLTDVLRDYAVEFIRDAPAERPLYLHLTLSTPHEPHDPAPRHANLHAGAQVERNAAFNEADLSDKPMLSQARALLTPEQIVALDVMHRKRLQMMASLDEAIVRVVDELEGTGRLRNTVIVVLSDNGLLMGEHRVFATKSLPYDGAVRVPMLVWGQGFAKGSRTQLVSNVDIVPTIVDLAGIRYRECDGMSLLDHTAKRDVALIQVSSGVSTQSSGFGLRSNEFMYFEYGSGDREYYDLQRDPFEVNNLLPPSGAQIPIPADLPRPGDLSAALARAKVCRGRSCP